MRRTAALLLVGLLCLSLCACAEQPVQTTPVVSEKPTVKPVEVRTFSLAYDPDSSLHPITGESPVNAMLTSLVYEGLFALDESWQPCSVLAVDAQVDGSGKVWTVAVREDVVFSDGTPLEVAHVVSSLNTARKSERYGRRLKDISSVKASDSKVVITLSVPNGNLPALLDVPIVLELEGEPAPLGTGRYRYAGALEELYLMVNYNRESRLPYETISLAPAGSTAQRISTFDSGASSAVLTDFASPYELGYSCDYERWDYPTTDLLFVGFRCVDGPCADALVRRAVACAMDRGTLVADGLLGYADPTTLPVPEGHPDWYGEAHEGLDYDPAEAEALLIRAGYTKNEEDGFLYRERKALELTLLVNRENEMRAAAAELLAAELGSLGITVHISKLPWEDYVQALKDGAFDLYLAEVRLTADFDVTELLTGTLNYGGFDVTLGLTDLIAARKGAFGDARAMSSRNLWNIFALEVPVAPLCFMRESMLVRWGAGFVPTPLQSDPFYCIENW